MNGKCARCGNDSPLLARGLCHACYRWCYRHDSIYAYSTVRRYRYRFTVDCRCAKPLVDRIVWFDAYECGRCHRRIANDRVEELGQ